MTEQEKQELIKDCQDEIESLKWRLFRTYSTGGCPDYLNSCLKRQELALASLTAEPVGYVGEFESTAQLSKGDMIPNLYGKSKMLDCPVGTKFYTAPPANVAAEIKMPEDLVEHKSGLYGHMPTLTLQTPDWADGYREALMDVKLLNEVK